MLRIYTSSSTVRKQQPLVINIHVCDDTEGMSTAVHVMSIVQAERKFSSVPGMLYYRVVPGSRARSSPVPGVVA